MDRLAKADLLNECEGGFAQLSKSSERNLSRPKGMTIDEGRIARSDIADPKSDRQA